ncbi:MAG: AbrB/MazE/SpoVT family DNA-binding domain-containing protein [Clostridia bacterium]|jgi:antitoxin MazE|nr:AbrB/MazE/SpoVT family DNA-binding domain-containing protein [Clostridia bacterium]
MYAKIQKWGNSHGIRIPKAMLDALNIRENDRVELTQADESITLRKINAANRKTLEEYLTAFYGKPIDKIGRIDSSEIYWGKPEGNEVW